MKSERRGLVLIVTVVALSAALGGIYGPNVRAKESSYDDAQSSVRTFTSVLDVVQANYAEKVDVDRVVYQGAIPGMLRMLDPHSNFFDARAWANNREEMRGRYYGVGMGVIPRGDHTIVMSSYTGTPAFRAGIRPGDIIVNIDDKSVEGKSTSEIADLLRGARGTSVKVAVSREGYAEPLVFNLTRDEIPHHAVDLAFEVKPGIGYIRFSTFNEKTDTELGEAMKQLNASSLDGLILDMRENRGGLLDEAIAASDMLLDKNQLIVSHRGRASAERRYHAVRGNRGNNMPLVILVNGNSASATEIVSGSVQDHDRGVIVGETTFGKGLVQTVQPLSENTGLALTIARYYTPSRQLIQRDYKSVSLYEYYEHRTPEHPTEVILTDNSRQVTGKNSITPNITVKQPELNRFQKALFRDDVFFPFETSVGGFTRHYLGTRPAITRDFEANDTVVGEFRKFLASKNLRYTETEMAENLDWVKRKIKQEVFVSMFGQQVGFKVQLETDPQLRAGINAIPQARALYEKARKIIAQRAGATTYRP